MSRQSTAATRRRAAAGRARSASRRKAPKRRPAARSGRGRRRGGGGGGSRVRRLTIGFAAIAIGALLGYVTFQDEVKETVRSVTLPLKHEDIIRQQSRDKDVDPALIAAMIYAESRFRDQTSPAGARGLMQVTPDTAHAIEDLSGGSTFEVEDLSDPDLNIRYGTFYLRHLLDKFDGNEVAAIAAYNGGETNVAAWGGSDLTREDIEFPETLHYVNEVLSKREDYREAYRSELGL